MIIIDYILLGFCISILTTLFIDSMSLVEHLKEWWFRLRYTKESWDTYIPTSWWVIDCSKCLSFWTFIVIDILFTSGTFTIFTLVGAGTTSHFTIVLRKWIT